MSIKLMSAVWDLDLPPSEKIVLLALADQANDAGRNCWPSVPTIARRSSQGERTVRRAIQSLEIKGFLTIEHRTGTSSQYHLHPCQSGTPANLTGGHSGSTPCHSGSTPLPERQPPPATVAGKTSSKPSNETSLKPKRAKATKIALPSWLPKEPWDGFLEMRKACGKKPTDRAIELLIAKLDRLRGDGHDPGAVLDQSTERNWQGLFEVKQNGQRNGNQNFFSSNGNSTDKRSGLSRAIDDGIEYLDNELAGIRAAQGRD